MTNNDNSTSSQQKRKYVRKANLISTINEEQHGVFSFIGYFPPDDNDIKVRETIGISSNTSLTTSITKNQRVYRGAMYPIDYYKEFTDSSPDSETTYGPEEGYDYGSGITHRLLKRRQFNGEVMGLYLAGGDAKKDTFLGDYTGVPMNYKQMMKRLMIPGEKYVAELFKNKLWICARDHGNVLTFINHNCDKKKINVELRKYKKPCGRYQLGMWLSRDTKDYEDLYFHYGKQDSYDIGTSCPCLCKGRDVINGYAICKYRL